MYKSQCIFIKVKIADGWSNAEGECDAKEKGNIERDRKKNLLKKNPFQQIGNDELTYALALVDLTETYTFSGMRIKCIMK